METVQRVYRFMAARFHPDNRKSGDVRALSAAPTGVRSAVGLGAAGAVRRPECRGRQRAARYLRAAGFHRWHGGRDQPPAGVLSILYHRRRRNEARPSLSLLDLEGRMALPRDYLVFTLWYLRAKGYVKAEDNSDFSLTAAGMDYLEAESSHNQMAHELMWPRRASVGPAYRQQFPAGESGCVA